MPAEQCAEVITILLDIKHSLFEISDYQNYKHLQCKLDRLARLIKGPWYQTMRSRYKPAGPWIASHAPRIELFIRHQQTKNVLLSANLAELEDAMTSTLVHAAGGNWHLIGADQEYANMVLTQRRTRIVRRASAIAISIVIAAAAPHFFRHSPALYQGIVAICVPFSLVELFGLIYPDAPTGLGIAGGLASVLKRGG
jgi:hypothetical protein